MSEETVLTSEPGNGAREVRDIVTEGPLQQETRIIINTFAPNTEALT